LSEAVTTQASSAGRLAGSKYIAEIPIAQSAVEHAKAAQTLAMNASPSRKGIMTLFLALSLKSDGR
jgi:hypothetical protein